VLAISKQPSATYTADLKSLAQLIPELYSTQSYYQQLFQSSCKLILLNVKHCAFEWIIHCNTQCLTLTIEIGLIWELPYASLQQKALQVYADYFLYWSFHSSSLILISSFDTKFCVILRGSLWTHLLIDLQKSHFSISKKLFFPLLTCHIRFVSIPSHNSGESVTLLVAK